MHNTLKQKLENGQQPIGIFFDTASEYQRVKKVFDFFARFKNATFFVKTSFHEKSRYARQKA